VLPILARYALDAGPEGFGALNVAMGIGSVVGGLLLATRVRPTIPLVIGSAFVFAVLIIVLGLAPSMVFALLLLVPLGCLSIVYTAGSNTLLQIEAREEFRGRVLGLFLLLWSGTTPFGSAFSGFVSDSLGVRQALVINGSICVLGVFVASGYLFLRRPRSEPGTVGEPVPATRPVPRR
jgi:MFS family permease